MNINASVGVPPTDKKGTIYNKGTAGVRYCSSRAVSCCGKVKRVHIKCANTLFSVTNPGDEFEIDKWIVDSPTIM